MEFKGDFSFRLISPINRALKYTIAVLALAGGSAAMAQTLPSDPTPSCTVASATFATWFQSGAPSLNGVVNPANSVTFPDTPNCSFYQWSKQMFLWLTSPAPPVYGGGGGFIFDSPAFYDVSPPDSSQNRTLIPHTPGFIRPLGLRVAQLGADAVQVVFAKTGQMLEVAPPKAGAPAPQIVDTTGKARTLAHVEFGVQGALVLKDATGAAIEPKVAPAPALTIGRPPIAPIQVQKIIVDNIPIFIDPQGNVVPVEQGEAETGDVLMSQNKSLVYYAIMVNDVYAYFLTGWRDNKIQPGNANPTFPTSLTDLNAITAFALANGKTFPDPDALAIEVKTAWVEASTLSDPSKYITITGTIPTYNTSSNTAWTPTGQKTVQLALVGMHVVGSTNGHPELIWSTFEHVGNTPLATYSYINTSGTEVSVPESPGGTWLFSASGNPNPFNQAHMQEVSPSVGIKALGSFTISPSNTLRLKPFGAASNVSPNPIDSSSAASNSEIISINNNVGAMMPSGDIRNNYIMSGATWAIPGVAPGGSGTGIEVGTSQLTNSTLETYDQGPATTLGGANCLDCHSSTNQNGSNNPTTFTVGVSHIFFAIKKLF
jgi:hypothetical protein